MAFRFKRFHRNPLRKTMFAQRVLFILILLFSISPLACAPRSIAPAVARVTGTEEPEPSTTAELTPTVDSATATVVAASPTSVLETPALTTPIVFVTEADARVQQSNPDQNYGEGTTLRADGAGDAEIESFIRFNVTGVSEPIQGARLRLYVNDNGTDDGPAVYATDTSWAESEITWNNRPARLSDAVDNKGSVSPNSWVEYDVTSLVSGDGVYSFALVADSDDGVVFSSRQGSQPPQLSIIFSGMGSGSPTETPPATMTPLASEGGEVILVGAGDISTCSNDGDEMTAQLLDAIPGTVFTTGDNAYDSGTYDEYINCYDPTWGRHKERTNPSPGNHEYRSEGAAGYFQYFNNIPSYYAYDLGSWRIYALNSEIDVSLTSPQALWLIADLAANPHQCVLAYWHRPRWSSGTHHGNEGDMQDFWQILYQANAELVLNGHEHNYERFAEMNAEGRAVTPGLREIVVGTGGRNHYEFDTPLLASEVRDATTYGVLKLTLRANGYDWEFVPVPGSSFTDSGSTDCH